VPGDHQPAQTGRTEEAAYPLASQRNVQTVIVERIPVETGDKQVSIDVMKQALDALERGETKLRYEAITALRERLAQPEQEPIAWAYPEGLEALKSGKPWVVYGRDGNGAHPDGVERIPLYLAPRQWQGLTDDEIAEVISGQFAERNYWVKITKALEAKLKEKNT
jgi:hypothetical protein